MRFARVPRVIRVCFWRGFRACCSARVPRATSHSNFLFLTTTTTATTSATTTTITTTTTSTTTTATATSTRSINSTRGLRAYAFRAGSARYARSRVVAFKFLSSHCYYYYDDYYYYLLILEVLIVRAGSARMRFVRVPRVTRVCVLRGFRACCSARVPRV